MRASVPWDKNFIPQGIMLGHVDGTIDNGRQPLSMRFGSFFQIPGVLCGMIDQGEITPAFPNEVAWPAGAISIILTL
jgi:hypothetical protein